MRVIILGLSYMVGGEQPVLSAVNVNTVTNGINASMTHWATFSVNFLTGSRRFHALLSLNPSFRCIVNIADFFVSTLQVIY